MDFGSSATKIGIAVVAILKMLYSQVYIMFCISETRKNHDARAQCSRTRF